MAKKSKNLCLLKGCGRKRVCRGLCTKHYNAAAYEVGEGRTSWVQLEQLKLCLPAGAQSGNPFRVGAK